MTYSFPTSPIIILIFTLPITLLSIPPYTTLFSLCFHFNPLYILTLTYPSNVQQGINLSWFSYCFTIYYIFTFFVTLPSILWYNTLSPLFLLLLYSQYSKTLFTSPPFSKYPFITNIITFFISLLSISLHITLSSLYTNFNVMYFYYIIFYYLYILFTTLLFTMNQTTLFSLNSPLWHIF